MNEFQQTIIKLIIGTILGICLIASVKNGMNSAQYGKVTLRLIDSNRNNNLEKIVTVYDYNGGVIKQWKGKFNLQENDQEIYFDDQNGKRVIIHGGIVITEEK